MIHVDLKDVMSVGVWNVYIMWDKVQGLEAEDGVWINAQEDEGPIT